MSKEHDADKSAETDGDIDSINRRRFVRGLGAAGGAAITGGVLSSSAQAAVPKQSPSKEQEILTGDELVKLAREVTGREDVRNVMDSSRRKMVQSGSTVDMSQKGQSGVVFTQNPGLVAKENDIENLQNDSIFVSAATHTLENGNEKTAVAYLNGDGQALGYYRHERPEVTTNKALLWDIIDDGNTPKLSRQDWSVNGEEPRPLTELKNDPGFQPNQHIGPPGGGGGGGGGPCGYDPCGGCHLAPPGGDHGRTLIARCSLHFDVGCALSAYGCYSCRTACVLGGVYGCVACVIISCGIAIAYSCCVDGEVTKYCAPCAGGCCGCA